MSVPKRAQLLQRLETLDRRRRKRRIVAQKAHAVGVEAIVAIQGQAERNFFRNRGETVARPRYRRPAEVQRVTIAVKHDLDHVGVECLRRIVDQVTCGCDRRVGMRGKRVGDGVDQLRLEQRLVALNVDDDGLVVEP